MLSAERLVRLYPPAWLAGETLKSVSFFAAFMLSIPFWLMKGQPWKAQAMIIVLTLALIVGASPLS